MELEGQTLVGCNEMGSGRGTEICDFLFKIGAFWLIYKVIFSTLMM